MRHDQGPVADVPTGCQVNQPSLPTKICNLAALPCDVDETCDGTNPRCPSDQVASSSTSCRPAECENGVATEPASCTGSDKECPAVVTVMCGEYLCDDGQPKCRTTCTTSAHCIATSYCNNGSCEPRIGAGAPCEDDSQCTTSNPFCVDGVC